MDKLYSVREIADFLMYCLGAAVLVVLIIALISIIKFVKRLDKLVADNTDNINKTATTLPVVVNNINDVSASLKDGISKAEQTVEAVEDYICETVTTVTESTESLFDVLSIAGEVMKTVISFFQGSKKK